MTTARRAFVGLGANLGDRRAHLETALFALAALPGTRLAAASAAFENPPVGGPPQPDYWNAVAELLTDLPAPALLDHLHRIETRAGRVRAERNGPRTLDLDLLALGDEVRADGPRLPHREALSRAFVLGPWAEIAPEHVVAGTGRCVLAHRAGAEARDPAAFAALRRVATLRPVDAASPPPRRRPVVLEDRHALEVFRCDAGDDVGFVPTMGALHEGHASLARRAVAGSAVAVASLFVNPLQFAPTEDLSRYPRTFDADLDLLGREGVHAVYAPAASDLYPEAFATSVVVGGPSAGYEGAVRPGHFAGVATVVAKLLLRVRPSRTWFGRKDAQQVAVVQRLHADLDLPGTIVVAPTVRDLDGLALSSRNRYLSEAERRRAASFPRALAAARALAASGETDSGRLVEAARRALATAGLAPDYLEIVDPEAFAPTPCVSTRPGLMVAAVGGGRNRPLENKRRGGPSCLGGPP